MSGRIEHYNNVPIKIANTVIIPRRSFYISYNDKDLTIYGCDTTALVKTGFDGVGTKFFILNGNHVNEYKDILYNGGSYLNCLEYFKSHLSMMNKFSDSI